MATDEKDVDEIKNNNTSTDTVPKNKKPKETNRSSDTTKKSNPNPSIQCDLCSVSISSEVVYNLHIKGRKHQMQLKTMLLVS